MHTKISCWHCCSLSRQFSHFLKLASRMLVSVLAYSLISPSFAVKPQIAATPAMGWNSWNHFACDISETLIKETTDSLIATGLADVGYKYVNLDDCWQTADRDSRGNVVADATRFPSGLKSLGDYIHDQGLKFGIYSCAGYLTCQKYPASLGYELQDANNYMTWGVDYLKYDNCNTDAESPYQRFPPMGQALQRAGAAAGSTSNSTVAHRDILYSLCEWGRENPAVWASTLAAGHSWRTTQDINDHYYSIVKITATNTPLWRYAGSNIGWNDPDMLEVGNGGCSNTEYTAHFSLWSIMKSPLIIGNDVRALDSATASILMNKEVIAVNQDSLGYQARRIWSLQTEDSAMSIFPSAVAADTQSFALPLIASKCASGSSTSSQYTDSVHDQLWYYNAADGTIRLKNTATGGDCSICLHEVTDSDANHRLRRSQNEEEEDDVNVASSLSVPHGVVAVNCNDNTNYNVTTWDMSLTSGGAITSRSSNRCLEVYRSNENKVAQGKRLQTGTCGGNAAVANENAKADNRKLSSSRVSAAAGLGVEIYDNIPSHQSWSFPVLPEDADSSRLMNLYQRQCLTIDRDAPFSRSEEIYATPLSNGDVAVLLWNKRDKASVKMSMAWALLDGMFDIAEQHAASKTSSATTPPAAYTYHIRDLWKHTDRNERVLPAAEQRFVTADEVPPHGVVMIRVGRQ